MVNRIGIGQRIIEYRAKNDLTLEQMGKIIGVTPAMVSRYECGSALPKRTRAVLIDEILKKGETEEE